MKHIKTYKLYESKEVISNAVTNALMKNNIELFKQLTIEYNDMIDYETVMKFIWGNKNYKRFPFLKYVPDKYKIHITTIDIRSYVVPSLDVSMFPYLEEIDCTGDGNDMKELITTGLQHLTSIDITNNYVKTLDLSTNPKLRHLHCEQNLLTEIDLTNNPNIKVLHLDSHVKVIR